MIKIRSGIGSPSSRSILPPPAMTRPPKTGNCRQSARHMRLIGGGVGYVNIADDVGGHRTLPASTNNSAEPSVWRKPPRRCNRLCVEEGVRQSAHFGLIFARKSSAGSTMTATRRLTAILAADVAGYSRLMGQDEVGTATALREHRTAADPLVAEHGGRIVKTTGDGVLIEFGSVVSAVECALALQKLATDRNTGIPGERRLEWRIGVHLGDVLVEGDDILGDGVNIAARLEGIAEPGGIS